MDQSGYTHYTTCSPPTTMPNNTSNQNIQSQCNTINNPSHPQSHQSLNPPSSPADSNCYPNQINNSPPQMIQKRKRSVNPQADENFIRALEAVRFGGIGFCKAARMYGVNNRTLWLEYKKRGYPNFRLSIKSRKQESESSSQSVSSTPPPASTSSLPPPPPPPPNQQQQTSSQQHQQELVKQDCEPILCTTSNHPVALISGTFFDGKPVDLGPVLQRPKYLDAAIINAQQAINFQGINYEHM